MKVLLIWESIPDSTDVYLLDGETADAALAAHNAYANTEGGEAAERLSELLVGLVPLADDTPPEINEPVKLVLSGFVM